MKVLLVSQDVAMIGLLKDVLAKHGYEVIPGDHPSAGWLATRPDLALLIYDLGDTTPHHWEELARWRDVLEQPLVVIGPAGPGGDVVRALRLGCDDYIRRPLHCAELAARINALVRRARMGGPPRPLEHDVILDGRSCQANVEGRWVELTPTEFKLLETLIEHRGRTITRDELIRQVWDKTSNLASTNLSLYIWHLRQKLEADPEHPKLIITRWGVGYSFREGQCADE